MLLFNAMLAKMVQNVGKHEFRGLSMTSGEGFCFFFTQDLTILELTCAK